MTMMMIIVVVVIPCQSASTVSIHGCWLSFVGCGGAVVVVCEWSWVMAVIFGWWWLFSQLLVIIGGAVVVMCEWSWAVAAVFVWWRSLVIILGSCSRFWVVVFDHGPLGWVEVGRRWASCCGYGRGVVEVWWR